MKEVALARVAGPYAEIPYQHFVQSPIGLVPKSGGQTRMIFHLSFDFGDKEEDKSINYHTPEDYCTVKYNDLDHAIRTCLQLEVLNPSVAKNGIFFSCSDLKSAFRTLPILPSQRKYLIFKAVHPTTATTWYFVEKCLPFGASSSCRLYQDFSNALRHILEYQLGVQFLTTNYLDDYLFVQVTEAASNHMVSHFLLLCNQLGVPVAQEKTVYATQIIVFLGMLLDGRNLRISIPEQKRVKALNLINWCLDRKKITILMIQRLTGILNFLCKAIVPGRTFTRMMYKKLSQDNQHGQPLKQYHHVTLDSSFLNDCRLWKRFLEEAVSHPCHLCRPFADLSTNNYATTLNFYSDAAKSEVLGFGAMYDGKYWFAGCWDPEFIRVCNPSIQFLELYALTAAILAWGHLPQLTNSRVVIFCDNKAVKSMVNSLSSGCPKCMNLLRVLAIDNMRYNRKLKVEYVRSADNELADALSRLDFNRFWELAPETMNRVPEKNTTFNLACPKNLGTQRHECFTGLLISDKRRSKRSNDSASTSSTISTSAIQQIVDKLRKQGHRQSTRANYHGIWKNFNEFFIRLDVKPDNWEDRIILFVGHLIDRELKSTTIRSYVSAVRTVLRQDGVILNEDLFLLKSLTKACKLQNDKVLNRLPIRKGLLNLLIKSVPELFTAPQPYLTVMYRALLATAYYGLFRIGEVTKGEHVVKVDDVSLGHNKDQMMFILRSSKTHDRSSKPQIIKITREEDESEQFHYRKNNWCPFALLQDYLEVRRSSMSADEQFFVFRDRSPVTQYHFRKLLYDLLVHIGLDPRMYGCRGFRMGRVTDMVEVLKLSVETVKKLDRWKSSMIYVYLRT